MNRTDLFTRTGNVNDMIALQKELIESNLFKLPVNKKGELHKDLLTVNSDVDKQDCIIASSNVDDFITVWARHERKGGKRAESASYGIRVKTSLYDIPSMRALLGNMNTSFNDTSEYRIACYSINDVKFFVTTILKYLQAHSISRNATKEVVTEQAVTA